MNHATRLDATIKAVCPIDGVGVGTFGDNSTVVIHYASSTTADQEAAAQAALASFDWSDEAQAAWLRAQNQAAAGPALNASNAVTIAIRGFAVQVLAAINANSAAIAELQTEVEKQGGKIALSPAPQLTEAQAKAGIGDDTREHSATLIRTN